MSRLTLFMGGGGGIGSWRGETFRSNPTWFTRGVLCLDAGIDYQFSSSLAAVLSGRILRFPGAPPPLHAGEVRGGVGIRILF